MAKIILTAITSRLQRRQCRPLINTSLTHLHSACKRRSRCRRRCHRYRCFRRERCFLKHGGKGNHESFSPYTETRTSCTNRTALWRSCGHVNSRLWLEHHVMRPFVNWISNPVLLSTRLWSSVSLRYSLKKIRAQRKWQLTSWFNFRFKAITHIHIGYAKNILKPCFLFQSCYRYVAQFSRKTYIYCNTNVV